MTDMIPATAREFERWMGEASHDWPPELIAAGTRALLTLKMMVGQDDVFAQSAALREVSAKDLMAFAQAYGEWKARS